MPLTRKARVVGSSLVLTIPSQLAKANDIKDGDELEIIPAGFGKFIIRKVVKNKRVRYKKTSKQKKEKDS